MRAVLRSPIAAQLAVLGAAGVLTLLSASLAPADRGLGSNLITTATVGAGLLNLSLDTTFPALGIRRLTGRSTLLCVVALALGLTGVGLLRLLTHAIELSVLGGLLVTLNAIAVAFTLSNGQILYLQYAKLAGGLIAIIILVTAITVGAGDGTVYVICWLASQVITLAMLSIKLYINRNQIVSSNEISGATLRFACWTHCGVLCSLWVLRADQIFVAHDMGSAALGIYALSAVAIEAAQAPGIIAGQREIRAGSDPELRVRVRRLLAQSLLLCISAVFVLFVLGMFQPSYRPVWQLSAICVPGVLALAVCRPLNANTSRNGHPMLPTIVNATIAALSVAIYPAAISGFGLAGAASASSVLYSSQLVLTIACRQRIFATKATSL